MNTSGAMDSNLLELNVSKSNLFGYTFFPENLPTPKFCVSFPPSHPLNFFHIDLPLLQEEYMRKIEYAAKFFLSL